MASNPPDRAPDRDSGYSRTTPRDTTEYYTDYDEKSGTIMKKSDLQARDGWVSPHPQRLGDGSMNPDWSAYVSPQQEKENMDKANAPKPPKEEYYTDYDEESGTIMKKSDLQKRDGWVSPHPQRLADGSMNPAWSKMVK